MIIFHFQELMKKVGEAAHAVGGDASGIQYPPLPSSDEEDIDEHRKLVTPPPGMDTAHRDANSPAPLLRR